MRSARGPVSRSRSPEMNSEEPDSAAYEKTHLGHVTNHQGDMRNKTKLKMSEISNKKQRTKWQILEVCVFFKVSDAQNTKSLSCDYNEVLLKNDLRTVLLHEELLLPVRERQR